MANMLIPETHNFSGYKTIPREGYAAWKYVMYCHDVIVETVKFDTQRSLVFVKVYRPRVRIKTHGNPLL